MEITTKTIDDITVLKLHGQLNVETAPELREFASDLINKGHKKLLLDCNLLDYVSSAGIQTLYVILEKIEQSNGKIALCGVTPNVQKVFHIVDLDSDIPLFPDQQASLAHFQ